MSHDAFDRIRSRSAADLKAAMHARDPVATAALRAALGVLDNATAVPQTPSRPSTCPPTGPSEVPARAVSAAEVDALLRAEARERAAAAIDYQRLEQHERAARLDTEARVIRECLRHVHPTQDAGP
jgi:uncharacterized protein YqeY